MSKTLPAAITTALSANEVRPFFAVDLMFGASGPLYLWTGLRDLTVGGVTYTGAGPLLEIGTSRETADLSAVNMTLSLSGLDSTIVSLSLTEDWQGRDAYIKFGVLDENDDPSDLITIWAGLTDQLNIEGSPDGATATLMLESKLVDLERPRVRRYTPESQRAFFPNDKAFDFVADLQDRKILFGQADSKGTSSTPKPLAFSGSNVGSGS